MNAVFGDTIYWIALTLPKETAHLQPQQVTGDILTTDEVLTGVLTNDGHFEQEGFRVWFRN